MKKNATKKSTANNNAIQIKTSSKKAAAAKKAPKKEKKEVAERNRIDQQLHLVKAVEKNPRREGSHGHKSFGLIKNGMTVEQAVQKGARLRDIHWDINKGYLKLTKKSA